MLIDFVKMQGLGNDFVLIDCLNKPELTDINNGWQSISKKLCNRRFGIGADQILLLSESNVSDFNMRIFNLDGSEVEMCGNGIRCLANYIWGKGLSDREVLEIETLAGIIKPQKANGLVRVDMGIPILEGKDIPVMAEGQIVDHSLKVLDNTFKITCVSMGNPHAVIIVEDIDNFPITYFGPAIENHEFFPQRTNVELIKILNRREIKMRVWERGAGETLSCGTGASAVCVASKIKGLTERDIVVHLKGGDLSIKWEEDNHVYMIGPAEKVYEGEIEVE